MQDNSKISDDRVYHPLAHSDSVESKEIQRGREQIGEETGEPEAVAATNEVKRLTTNPLEGKEKAEDYIFKHPEESRASKFFQSKPGRILKPLGRTFQIGGYAAAASGIGVGLMIGLPGFLFAGAGAGIGKLGDKLVEKSKERRKNVRDELIGRVGEAHILSADINKWGRGEGNKSLQRLNFEVLESEIQDSSSITDMDKVTLLNMFSDKKVGSKEYKILLNEFAAKEKKTDSTEISQANFMGAISGVVAGSSDSEQIEKIKEGNVQEINKHRETSLLKAKDADSAQIEEETKDPLNAKEKVDQYLSNDTGQGVDLHPKETQASKIFQRKPDRVLKPLGQTLQIAGMAGGVVGAGIGLLIGLPGVLVAGLGAGSVSLGNKIVQKTKDRRSHVANELEGRLTSADSKLLEDIGKWRKGGGEKSLPRLRFEVLEAEIKNSSDITPKDKSTLLQMFVDKKVGKKEYGILLDNFEKFKKKSSDFQEIMKEMLPENVDQAVIEKIKKVIANHNIHGNDGDFYGELVQLIRNYGSPDYQRVANEYGETFEEPIGIFKKLTIPLRDSDYKQVIKMLPEDVSQDVKNELIDLVYTRKGKTDNDFYKELLDLIIAHGNAKYKKSASDFREIEDAVSGQNYVAFFKISALKEESIPQTAFLSNTVGLKIKE